jgi:hypothetical protein
VYHPERNFSNANERDRSMDGWIGGARRMPVPPAGVLGPVEHEVVGGV